MIRNKLSIMSIILVALIGLQSCRSDDSTISKSNPLLEEFNDAFGVAPFDKIKSEHFMPAIQEGIKRANSEIEAIINNSEEPTFTNTIEAFEKSGSLLNRTNTLLGHLNSAETNENIQKAQREVSPLITDFYNNIILNDVLFSRIKIVYNQKNKLNLDVEQTTLINNIYNSFAKNGANLSSENKEKLKDINKQLSSLAIKFGENSLAETNNNFVEVDTEEKLSGIPEDAIARAKKVAEEKGKESLWIFTLHGPSYVAVIKYADNRELREQMYREYKAQGNNGNENDNREVVKQIVTLRYQKAKLLGYKNYADFVLTERMAESAPQVLNFLDDLLDLAKPVALKEKSEVEAFMKKNGAKHELQKWDWSYYSNKLKKEKFNISDDDLKPYFEIDEVQKGMFEIANKLYGLNFTQITNIPTWHKDVKTFDVTDEKGNHVAIFYTDYFPRPGKRGGAWMNSLKKQRIENGVNIRPQVINICSFTPPTDTKPSLLTFREVVTMFHEFGHGLHGMLANTHYESLSGTSVYRDFVELPSQIMENWVSEPEALRLFAKHYETGEVIPTELVDRIIASSTFNEGYTTIRQLSFGFLDMEWHSLDAEKLKELNKIVDFEQKAMGKTNIFPVVENDIMSTQFGHLFAGGYAAGYYSYKWAEVLDADAFEVFKNAGIFDNEIANRFKENILTKGGTEHPLELYKKFSGSEPSPKALAKRAGFIK